MACGAEKHSRKPTEVHGTGWESSAAGMGRGTAPCLCVSHIALCFVLLAEIYNGCPPLLAGRWLLTETATPGVTAPGDELRCRSQHSLGAWWGGIAHGHTTWHPTVPQPSRHTLTTLCCCYPEQGQAALLGKWDREEGGLAEWLAWLRQWAHGHERLLPRIWTRYSATIPGVPLPLQPHGPHPCSPWHTRTPTQHSATPKNYKYMAGLPHYGGFVALHLFYSWRNRAERCEETQSASLWCPSAVTISLPWFPKFWPKLSILFKTHESCFCFQGIQTHDSRTLSLQRLQHTSPPVWWADTKLLLSTSSGLLNRAEHQAAATEKSESRMCNTIMSGYYVYQAHTVK